MGQHKSNCVLVAFQGRIPAAWKEAIKKHFGTTVFVPSGGRRVGQGKGVGKAKDEIAEIRDCKAEVGGKSGVEATVRELEKIVWGSVKHLPWEICYGDHDRDRRDDRDDRRRDERKGDRRDDDRRRSRSRSRDRDRDRRDDRDDRRRDERKGDWRDDRRQDDRGCYVCDWRDDRRQDDRGCYVCACCQNGLRY